MYFSIRRVFNLLMGCNGTFVVSLEGAGHVLLDNVAGERDGYVLFAMSAVDCIHTKLGTGIVTGPLFGLRSTHLTTPTHFHQKIKPEIPKEDKCSKYCS